MHNSFLDHHNKQTPSKHPVFGRIVSGMEIVKAIEATPTSAGDKGTAGALDGAAVLAAGGVGLGGAGVTVASVESMVGWCAASSAGQRGTAGARMVGAAVHAEGGVGWGGAGVTLASVVSKAGWSVATEGDGRARAAPGTMVVAARGSITW